MFQAIINFFKKLFAKKADIEPVIPAAPIPSPPPFASPYSKLFVTALQEVGVKEEPGGKENPRIAEYAKATAYGRELGNSYRDSDVAWCAMFINWCLLQTHQKGTDSAAAISFLKWGVKLAVPVPGCIVVLQYPNGNHHVGLYSRTEGNMVVLLAGNQGNMVCEKAYAKSEIIGMRGFA